MLFPEASFIPAAKCTLSDLEGKAWSFAGSAEAEQISDLCQDRERPNQAFYRQWTCQDFLPQSGISSSDVHCGKRLGKYDGNKRGRWGKQKILQDRQSFQMSAGRAFCLCRVFLRLIFRGLARANPLGQNAARITISMSWSAAPGLWERRGEERRRGRRLECRPDTISWTH